MKLGVKEVETLRSFHLPLRNTKALTTAREENGTTVLTHTPPVPKPAKVMTAGVHASPAPLSRYRSESPACGDIASASVRSRPLGQVHSGPPFPHRANECPDHERSIETGGPIARRGAVRPQQDVGAPGA